MKYYALVDKNLIAIRVYEMPETVAMTEEQGFIEISYEVYTATQGGTEDSVIGMRWDKTSRSWKTITKYYYAVVIEKSFRKDVTKEDEKRYFVKDIVELTDEVKDPLYIPLIDKEDAQVGQLYNPETDGFTTTEFIQVAFTDTDQISVNGKNVVLTDKLTQMEDVVANIHIPEVTAESIAAKLKTVDGSGSGLDADLLDGKDSTYFATAAGLQSLSTTVSGKAASNHTHDFSNVYAPVNHSHPRISNVVVAHSNIENIRIDPTYSAEHSQFHAFEIKGQLGGWVVSNGCLVVPKSGNYLVELDGYTKAMRGSLGTSGTDENIVWIKSNIIKNTDTNLLFGQSTIKPYHCTNREIVLISAGARDEAKTIVYLKAGDQIKLKVGEQCKSSSMSADCTLDTYVGLKLIEV